jgi:hypothetical protein
VIWTEILIPGVIYVLVPAAGLLVYLVLCRRLHAASASWLFLGQLFLLFSCYGGVLLIILTLLLWEWSGAATLGAAFLVFVAPIILLPVTANLWRRRDSSPAQRIAFRACIGYYLLLIASIGIIVAFKHLLDSSR